MESIRIGNIRVQLLSQDLIRLEYGRGGRFCDQNTFHIPNRGAFTDTAVACSLEENVLCFGQYELYIPENARSLHGIRLEKQGRRVYVYKKLRNSGQLPRPQDTPAVFALADNPRILVPETGYAPRKNRKTGGYRVQENVQDVYLLLCDGDAAKLRRLFVELTGPSELVRLSTLGSWNSKFYAYTEETARQLIRDYQAHGVPLDNMVIDTDWRMARERGIGYDVNTKLFPDLPGFLDFAHSQGVEVMFNDHPEPVAGAENLLDPIEIAYREEKLQGIMEQGVDIWWYDRNWHTRLKSPSPHIPPDTMGMYAFEDITRHFYQKQAKSKTVYRRPVIMANADHVHHGRFWGVSNSASHRFSIQWTGDIHSESDSLAREVENLILGSEQCLPYLNADCGGHLGNPGKEWFIRWMQFGTLSPVFRPHASCFVSPFREPWNYDEETLNIVRQYNLLRYRLLPALYSAAYENYRTGMPMFRSLALAYPGDKRAENCRSQYLFGKNLLIAPIVGQLDQPLDKKCYAEPVKAEFYAGAGLEGQPLLTKTYQTLNFTGYRQPVEPNLPETDFSARLETAVCLPEDREVYLRCDDGAAVWVNGEKVAEQRAEWSAEKLPLGLLKAGEMYRIAVEYYQTGPERVCMLCAQEPEQPGRAVYLPQGQWMDAFTGKIYRGGRTVRRVCDLREMPLYIRLGTVLPLTEAAQTTRDQDWSRMTYDCYPGGEDAGFLYEDDGETTAYQLGRFRTGDYTFEGETLTLRGTEGEDTGCDQREITVKYHCLKGGKVSRVTVNGEPVAFEVARRDRSAFPIHTDAAAPDADVVLVRFTAPVTATQEIHFERKV